MAPLTESDVTEMKSALQETAGLLVATKCAKIEVFAETQAITSEDIGGMLPLLAEYACAVSEETRLTTLLIDQMNALAQAMVAMYGPSPETAERAGKTSCTSPAGAEDAVDDAVVAEEDEVIVPSGR